MALVQGLTRWPPGCRLSSSSPSHRSNSPPIGHGATGEGENLAGIRKETVLKMVEDFMVGVVVKGCTVHALVTLL